MDEIETLRSLLPRLATYQERPAVLAFTKAGWTGIAFGPVFRVLRRLTHVVPIDPERAAASSLAFGAAVLRDKDNLVWFPEGARSRTGQLEPLKPGIGLLLERYPVPVVPVHLDGTYKSLPPGRALPRPGRIRVAFGQPLVPPELEQKGRGDRPHERITSALYEEMVALGGGKRSRSMVEHKPPLRPPLQPHQ